MMKTIFLFLILTLGHFVHGQWGGELVGTVVDERGEPRPFAKVIVSKNDSVQPQIIAGANTDFDGHFRIAPVEEGIYNIVISDYDEDTVRLSDVEIEENRITFLGTIEIKRDIESLPRIPLIPNPVKRVQLDQFGRSIIINPEDIRRP